MRATPVAGSGALSLPRRSVQLLSKQTMARALYLWVISGTLTIAMLWCLSVPRSLRIGDYTALEWLEIGYGTHMTHEDSDMARADTAIKALSPQVLTLLTREMRAQTQESFAKLIGPLPRWLPGRQRLYFMFCMGEERRQRAISAFESLGGAATPAVADLRKLAEDPNLGLDACRAHEAIVSSHDLVRSHRSTK